MDRWRKLLLVLAATVAAGALMAAGAAPLAAAAEGEHPRVEEAEEVNQEKLEPPVEEPPVPGI